MEKPTSCSNYRNILHLDYMQEKLEKKQDVLEQRIDAMDKKTRLHLESANSNISVLGLLVTNLSKALKELEGIKIQTKMEFRDAKTQLETQKTDIASLRRNVRDLIKHREIVGGNISEIEKKLNATEKQFREKEAKLDNLETETEAKFMDAQRLLDLYKSELSHLNRTANELEVKVEARLNATKTELETKLKEIENNSAGT